MHRCFTSGGPPTGVDVIWIVVAECEGPRTSDASHDRDTESKHGTAAMTHVSWTCGLRGRETGQQRTGSGNAHAGS